MVLPQASNISPGCIYVTAFLTKLRFKISLKLRQDACFCLKINSCIPYLQTLLGSLFLSGLMDAHILKESEKKSAEENIFWT